MKEIGALLDVIRELRGECPNMEVVPMGLQKGKTEGIDPQSFGRNELSLEVFL